VQGFRYHNSKEGKRLNILICWSQAFRSHEKGTEDLMSLYFLTQAFKLNQEKYQKAS
jgi:hypothetical protein